MPVMILTQVSRDLKRRGKKVKKKMFSFLNIDNFVSIPRFEIKGLKQNHIVDEGLHKERQSNNIL